MDIFFGRKRKKKIIIVAIIGISFLLIFPIFAKYAENTATSQIVSSFGFEGAEVGYGGNNYVSMEKLDTIEDTKEHLTQSGLWNASIESSNEAQIEWYKRLTKELEETYIEPLEVDFSPVIYGKYVRERVCNRDYTGDYASDQCDFNDSIINVPELIRASLKGACKDDNVKIYNIPSNKYQYYESYEGKKPVGGKILGLYPDVLVSASLANTYSLLDQNISMENEMDSIAGYLSSSNPAIREFYKGVLGDLLQNLVSWYANFDNVASSNAALNDVFAEGSLYSTFKFMPDVKCKPRDVARYDATTNTLPKITDKDGNLIDYECLESDSVPTACKKETYNCDNPETEDKVETCEREVVDEKSYEDTDGYPDTYYQHYDSDEKSCDYEPKDGTYYILEVEWICEPDPSTPSPVKCTPMEVKDKMGNILYYICSNVNESEVRTKIVDPIFDAYENNTLVYNDTDFPNKLMTEETAKKFVYGMDEEEKKEAATGLNPKGYKIDEQTRQIVTKHIVMEILGQIEGRSPAIADKNGNFYLQSYNKVLNIEQYKDALNSTILEKDNILRKEGELTDETPLEDKIGKVYSEKLYGVFYSEYNSAFEGWTEEQINTQKIKDKSTKQSQIMEIFSTYEYISYYLQEYGNENSRTSGSGLELADSTGYTARSAMPYYDSDEYNANYTSGLYGECAWYALGRVKEILKAAKSTYQWTENANGGDWCNISHTKDFVKTTNSSEPKKGSVIVWKGGQYGHVAIIENVYYDANGKAISVDLSEAGLNINSNVPGTYTSEYIWDHDTLAIRRQQCGDIYTRKGLESRCFKYTKNISVSNLVSRFGYSFQCYIYLLKDNNNNESEEDSEEIE